MSGAVCMCLAFNLTAANRVGHSVVDWRVAPLAPPPATAPTGRPEGTPLRASAPGCAHLTGWTELRATRKPMKLSRAPGVGQRYADRQRATSLLQLPPRRTRA